MHSKKLKKQDGESEYIRGCEFKLLVCPILKYRKNKHTQNTGLSFYLLYNP